MASSQDQAEVIFKSALSAENDEQEIHSLPCKIEYTGPAAVEKYFQRETLDCDTEVATFRGRILQGKKLKLPRGFHLYAAKEKFSRGMQRILDLVTRRDKFMVWEYDCGYPWHSTVAEAVDFLELATEFAGCDD